MKARLTRSAFVAVMLAMSAAVARADEAPSWVATAAAQDVSKVDPKAPAVVLWDSGVVTVSPDGEKVRTVQWAIRVLKREGRDLAVASVPYNTDEDRITDFRAWLIRPDRKVKKYGKGETLDVSTADDVYDQNRRRVISARDEAEPGSVFAYEATVEDRSIFAEFQWFFHTGLLPVAVSRFTVKRPPHWPTKGVVFNHPNLAPVEASGSMTWELRDLPYLEDQPMAPSMYNYTPRLAVQISGTTSRGPLRTFGSWNDVAAYIDDLAEEPSQTTEAVSAKAAELVASATTEIEKIRRIGEFAQSLKYVAIQLGTAGGGGYRPHAASEVFAKSYGDCKDKAALMRALLKAAKIDAFLVLVNASDRYFVKPEWPSPQQFNHAIIAVKVSEETSAPSVINHPELGRLLIFDSTDPYTPVGDLPLEEQGSYILVASKQTQALTQLPIIDYESNRLERTVEATVGADAGLTARVVEHSYGQAARRERRSYKSQQSADYRKAIESWVTSGVGGAQVSKVDCHDDFSANRFDLDVELTATGFAQLMQGRLLIFKPALLSRRGTTAATEGERKHPIEIQPTSFVENASIALPPGFAVDELPESVVLETEFGIYEGKFETDGQTLKLRRRLSLRPMILPAEKYKEVKAFFDKISATEQAPVVLIKK